MMILVGQLDSPFVRRVAATMHHYDLSFDRHVLSVFGDRDEVVRLNPLGKVPALILEGEETLVDSAAIIDYLDELAPPDKLLTPRSGPARRRILRLSTVAMGMSERVVQLRIETVRRPEHLQFPEFVANYRRAIRDSLDLLEREALGPWMTGGEMTQADFSVVSATTHLVNRLEEFADLQAWSKLKHIRSACEDLDAFRAYPFGDN